MMTSGNVLGEYSSHYIYIMYFDKVISTCSNVTTGGGHIYVFVFSPINFL